MTRIAILGGGISGLAAAYELELARKRGAPVDWHLYEASDRLGGIVETTRIPALEDDLGEWILEGGPDAWVTEKPWARELAVELGLEAELIFSNDATRKTYILVNNALQPIPDRMRLMVPDGPEALFGLDTSPLFSPAARTAFRAEPTRAEELRSSALDREGPTPSGRSPDESVASFVLRHFGDEVLTTLAAPLLSGVFGGDVHKLSARAVMPQFVALERDHGSLILGLEHARSRRAGKPPQPIFTSLRRGMASLVEALLATLPPDRLHTHTPAQTLFPAPGGGWLLRTPPAASSTCEWSFRRFDHVLLATPVDATRTLLAPIHPAAADLLPTDASSAVLAAFAWTAVLARTFPIPPGFGFLVPPNHGATPDPEPALLACTFVDQKFPHRAPAGARILRAFFGGSNADALSPQSDEAIATAALTQLRTILGPLPDPMHTTVRRWPRSLPQYEVGHLNRMARLDSLIAQLPGLALLGNSYRGVGLPDLIHAARQAARSVAAQA